MEIAIIRYDYSLHFKSEGINFRFSPREGLVVEGREIELERVEPHSWSDWQSLNEDKACAKEHIGS